MSQQAATAKVNNNAQAQGGLDPALVAHIKSQMADIIEPAAISWWPLAWGWWVLIVAACITLALLVWLGAHHYLANRYRRNALKTLHAYAQQDLTAQQQAQNLMQLTKQIALHAYPNYRNTLAKTYGQSWLDWLNSTTKMPLFNNAHAQHWQQALYMPPNPTAKADPKLTTLLQQWIKQHQKEETLAKQQPVNKKDTIEQTPNTPVTAGNLNV